LKRLTLGGPLVLFLFLTSCGSVIDENTVYQVGLTQTVAAYTATPINTPHPSERLIVDIINSYLQTPENPLSETLDAKYRVVKVSFIPNSAGNFTTFLITAYCECARDGTCCNVEHTFALITRAMKASPEIFVGVPPNIPSAVPQTINELYVECYDHQNRIGTLYVSWSMMREYLIGTIGGNQLGWSVQKQATPTP